MTSPPSQDTLSAPCLFVFREDLRLTDNPALCAALECGRPVICLYVFDKAEGGTWAAGGARRWWLHHALSALSADLEARGGQLIMARGAQNEIVLDTVRSAGAQHVYWTRRYAPYQIKADKALKLAIEGLGAGVTSLNGRLLFEPWRFETGSGNPYRVFTPFWRAMKARGRIREIAELTTDMNWARHASSSLAVAELNLLPTRPNWAAEFDEIWQPGEAGARKRLARFIGEAAHAYKDGRNRPDKRGTSGLSPHLHHGEISPVQIWHAVMLAVETGDIPEDQADVFLSEIAWREFSHVLLFSNPDMLEKEINPRFAAFPWAKDGAKLRANLQAWQRGMTGYPVVDAGMRQLWQTGWMHNRVRMIVGSFLVKHLLIDWRDGMSWFWDTLVDADIAANTASWQWIAGCGADAAPYFRVFNPMLQGEKFDPNGDYIRRFVPEVAALPKKYLYAPWSAPQNIMEAAGLVLGRDYPAPIVDHKIARERALAAYASTKP